MQGGAIEGDRLELLVRGREDRRGGLLVDAAALHPDQPVFDQVDPADAVLAADLVERLDHLDGLHLRAVDGDWPALLEADL